MLTCKVWLCRQCPGEVWAGPDPDWQCRAWVCHLHPQQLPHTTPQLPGGRHENHPGESTLVHVYNVSLSTWGYWTVLHGSSVQDGIYALKKAIMHSTPSLRSFSIVAVFETVLRFVWLTMALLSFQGRSSSASSFQASPPGDRWCDVLGFVPTGSVSSSSTLKIFQEASHLWGLLCPPIYLLGHFSSL